MSYEPTLIPFFDAAPCPRVEVLFTAFAPGTATVTVYRTAGGRAFRVRGGVNAATAGGLTRMDMEVPFGVPASYRAEMFNSAGMSLGFTGSTAVTMHVTQTWVHNPLDPQGATTVEFRDSAARSLVRPVEGRVVYPQGRSVGVLVSGQRRGLQGVDLTVVTDTIGQVDRLQAMFGSYSGTVAPVLCFRIGAFDQIRLPRTLFAAVLAPDEQDVNYVLQFGEQITTVMQGDEVSPPTPALFIPTLTNADLNAYYLTNTALKADNLTNLAVNRRYDLIGAA